MRSDSKLSVALIALLFVASACSSKSGTGPIATSGNYGSGVNLNLPKNKNVPQEPGKPAAGGGSQNYQAPPHPGTNSSGGGGSNIVITKHPTDYGGTGRNSFWYLNAKTPALDIEIDAIAGMAPSQKTINVLNQRLHSVANKPSGIRFLPVQTIPGGKSTWTMQDVAKTQSKYRNTHNSLDRASISLLFVNGQPAESGPIGIAYNASSDVIFEETIRGAATPLVSAQSIEVATVIHEVGHLLALINETYQSPRDHEDAQHPGHSNNQASVMYWAIDNVGVATLLGGSTEPTNQFDKDDLADLADIKAGKLGPH